MRVSILLRAFLFLTISGANALANSPVADLRPGRYFMSFNAVDKRFADPDQKVWSHSFREMPSGALVDEGFYIYCTIFFQENEELTKVARIAYRPGPQRDHLDMISDIGQETHHVLVTAASGETFDVFAPRLNVAEVLVLNMRSALASFLSDTKTKLTFVQIGMDPAEKPFFGQMGTRRNPARVTQEDLKRLQYRFDLVE